MSDALEVIEWFVRLTGYAFSGWRYLLSPSYRRRTHARWRVEGRGRASVDIVFCVLGFSLTVFFGWLLVDYLRD